MRTHGQREGSIIPWGLWRAYSGSWGGISWEEMPDKGDGEKGSKPHCQVCAYATILYILQIHLKTQNAVTYLKKKTALFYIPYTVFKDGDFSQTLLTLVILHFFGLKPL